MLGQPASRRTARRAPGGRVEHDAGLARRARLDAQGRDERVYLAPLIEAAARGLSIGDVVLGDWSGDGPDALASLLARAAY